MAEKHERILSSAIQSVLSFGLMFIIIYAMVISYPKELAWLSRTTTELWKEVRGTLNASFLANYHLGKVLLNQLRLINGSHVLIMLGCTVLAAPLVGALFSRTRSAIGRMITSALTSVAGISVGTGFLLLNLSSPDTLGYMLDVCEWVWHRMINLIEATLGGFDFIQGLVNFARTGINGHHMLLISFATFICGWGIRKVWDSIFPRMGAAPAKAAVPPPPPPLSRAASSRPTRVTDSPLARVLKRRH